MRLRIGSAPHIGVVSSVWKLQVERNVTSEDEAHALFRELKRFFLVSDACYPQSIPMFSRRVDVAWHQFVLFTRDYGDFCKRFFHRYLHHQPNWNEDRGVQFVEFKAFAAIYESLFGERPPPVWQDEIELRLDDRIRYDRIDARFDVRLEGEKAELLVLGAQAPEVVLRVDAWAEPALRFIASHPCFYVRELPGLDDEDKAALATALARTRAFCLTF
ncbi:hypothetical protein [Polyangium sp. 6x1]|uniref:hypothetical protein n=1 Tax=Polyangium sp. 6x1 TaxID=3042689 RepID=UPI002482184E|nr:hypothetical protein [Polyangium sp. 6x1]MDI1442534.1 hypothetical protein [Polyangium sp. 6x1]